MSVLIAFSVSPLHSLAVSDMREQREYRYGLAGINCTRSREAGCVDGTDNDNENESDDKEKDRDKDKDRNDYRNMDKSKWLTSKGFQYPALKTKEEEMTHPKRPPDSTIENLRKPWYDIIPSSYCFLFLPLS